MNGLRGEVLAFALLMERELRENDHKGGWDECGPGWLLRRLGQEVDELRRAMKRHEDLRRKNYLDPGEQSVHLERARRELASEAADVANFAMMIVDVCGALGYAKEAA